MNPLEFNKGAIRPIECYKEAWQIIKSDYWMLFAISLVGLLLGGFSLYIALGPLICGIFICFFRKIDTGTVNFEDLWKGFNFFAPSLIVILIIIVPTLFLYGMIYAPIMIAVVMGQNLSSEEFLVMMVAALAIDLVIIVVMVCFHTLVMFALPLIVDRNLSALEAIKLSMRSVWANLSGIAGMMGIQFVASIVITFATCGIGAYFVLPIMFGGMVVAYRKVFPSMNLMNFAPPTPDNFQNAGNFR